MGLMNRHCVKHEYKILACLCLLFLCLAIFVFGATGDDDSHITYTAAKNLADTGVITNNNGDMVEQGSSLLHVILLGFSYKILASIFPAYSIADLGPLFSLMAALACIPLLYNLLSRAGIERRHHAMMLLLLSTAFAGWSMGGLEATLVAACLLLLIMALDEYLKGDVDIRHFSTVLFVSALYLMVRPEAFFVLLLSLFIIMAIFKYQGVSGFNKKIVYVLVGISILFSLLCLWRYWLYGQIFPQPVYAKSEGISLQKIIFGAYYFLYSMQITLVFYCMALLLLLWKVARKSISLPIPVNLGIAFSISTLAFIVVSGGDWMTGGRFFVPVIPLFILLVFFTFQHHKHYKVLFSTIIFFSILEISWFTLKISAGIPVQRTAEFSSRYSSIDWSNYSFLEKSNMVHARDIPAVNQIDTILSNIVSFRKAPIVMASTQMGLIPHHLHQRYGDAITFIDLRGLASRHITDCKKFSEFPKNWFGIAIAYKDYLDAGNAVECHLPKPDIIYDLLEYSRDDDEKTVSALVAAGYKFVYWQTGKLVSFSGYKAVKAGTFIAVTPDIFDQLPENLQSGNVKF